MAAGFFQGATQGFDRGIGLGSELYRQAMAEKRQAEQDALAKQAFDRQQSELTPSFEPPKNLNLPMGVNLTRGESVRNAERMAEIEAQRKFATQAKQQGQQNNMANQFRDEFNQLSKPFMTVAPMYKNVESSALNPNPTAASDMNMIFAYMKILDPNSTVREGEYATAAKAGSFGDRVRVAVQQLETGQKLTDSQRANFLDSAKQAYQSQLGQQQQHTQRYTELSKRAGVDPRNVVFDFQSGGMGPQTEPKNEMDLGDGFKARVK